jgi:hypothetical protein
MPMADAVDTCTRTDERRALKRAAPARGGSAPCGAAAAAAFRILDLPLELQSLIVEQMPLRTMARLALTHADWAAMVQRSLRRGHSWAQSYADHRCCHDLTGDARAAIAPMGKWAWRDHLHVLEAVAVRAHPSEFSLLVEDMVVQEWWSSKFFDEQAASQATARCLVGRAVRGVSPQVVLDLFGVFTARRNPALRVIHCTESGDEHAAECGGFCADDEMATRAWSLRALTKPLGVSDAAVLRACLSQWQLSAEHTAMFLLNYVGTVWEMWDFTSADAARLAALAVELRLDGATVAALLCRLAAEEDAEQRAAGITTAAGAAAAVEPQPRFVCTLTLLLEWAQAVQFPGGFPAEERKLVLEALVMQAHRPGFKAAAGPVIAVWTKLLAAAGLACAPCEPAHERSSSV